jgi:hypothetical protein
MYYLKSSRGHAHVTDRIHGRRQLRSRSNNLMEILDPQVIAQVDQVILSRLGGV